LGLGAFLDETGLKGMEEHLILGLLMIIRFEILKGNSVTDQRIKITIGKERK
jgi:hypothetical protein